MECLNYGTDKCKSCSQGQQSYCKTLHEKIENGTYDIAQDHWDYIDAMISDEELEELFGELL